MNGSVDIRVSRPIDRIVRHPEIDVRTELAALLFDEMRERLLWPLLPHDRNKAVRLLVDAVCWEDVYAAVDAAGAVIATAFVSGQDQPLCMSRKALRHHWGIIGATWRIALIDAVRIGQSKAGSLRVEALAVKPDHRTRGIGSQLMERIIADARAAGYSALSIDVSEDNAAAQNLASSLGFTVTRTLWAVPSAKNLIRSFSSMQLNL